MWYATVDSFWDVFATGTCHSRAFSLCSIKLFVRFLSGRLGMLLKSVSGSGKKLAQKKTFCFFFLAVHQRLIWPWNFALQRGLSKRWVVRNPVDLDFLRRVTDFTAEIYLFAVSCFRLAGYAPFYHRRQLIMLRMIQEAKYEFRAEQWAQITFEAKDLVGNILLFTFLFKLISREL